MHLRHILNIQMQLDPFLVCHAALSLCVLVSRVGATLCVCEQQRKLYLQLLQQRKEIELKVNVFLSAEVSDLVEKY